MRTICALNGIVPLVERSRSGQGRISVFFVSPIPAALARRFGFALLEKGAEQVNLKSFQYYDRMLSAQDILPEGEIGNLIALPLLGKALARHSLRQAHMSEHRIRIHRSLKRLWRSLNTWDAKSPSWQRAEPRTAREGSKLVCLQYVWAAVPIMIPDAIPWRNSSVRKEPSKDARSRCCWH